MSTEAQSKKHVVVYGGSGFVGLAVCQALIEKGFRVSAVSRSGRPLYLSEQQGWGAEVNWVRGDALIPNNELLSDADSVVALIGSPPLPTMSDSAYRQKVFSNSEPNRRVIEAAAKNGVKNIVLMAAHVPQSLRTRRFAYWEGKRKSIEAAKHFVEESTEHSATVCYPSGIYGTRYLSTGFQLPLHWFMAPVAAVQKIMPGGIRKCLPATLVADKQVAAAVVNACEHSDAGIHHISNEEIAKL